MRLVKLPGWSWSKDAQAPDTYVCPEHVAAVTEMDDGDGKTHAQVTAGTGFFDVALSLEDTLRALGATVTEVVFRDVTPG